MTALMSAPVAEQPGPTAVQLHLLHLLHAHEQVAQHGAQRASVQAYALAAVQMDPHGGHARPLVRGGLARNVALGLSDLVAGEYLTLWRDGYRLTQHATDWLDQAKFEHPEIAYDEKHALEVVATTRERHGLAV